MEESSIIEEWLRSLELVQYTQDFLDNGYDDLEICKQIGEADLDAIGVTKEGHRKEILDAVLTLRQQGGTSVYFTLEEALYEDKASLKSQNSSKESEKNADTSPHHDYAEPEEVASVTTSGTTCATTTDESSTTSNEDIKNKEDKKYSDASSVTEGSDGDQQVAKAAQEKQQQKISNDGYVEGKRAIVSFPKIQLAAILRDRLTEENAALQNQNKVNQINISSVITTRKRNLRRLCFHRCLSVHGGGSLSRGSLSGRPPRTVTCGRYASYWNAFLLTIIQYSLPPLCNVLLSFLY